jgi:D-amino-acid dehydrogenase
VKAIVLGAGIVGTATAYFLAKNGLDVEVIERQSGAALETSFGNGGVLHASEVEPWSQPGMPFKILKWLGNPEAPLLVRYRALPKLFSWGAKFVANCTPERFERNALANLRLALHSLDVIKSIRNEAEIDYDLRTNGALRVFTDARSFDMAAKSTEKLAGHGLKYEVMDAAGTVRQEPALADASAKLAGALYFPRDEIGDCHKFTQALAKRCEAMGVRFRYGTSVTGVRAQAGKVSAVVTDKGEIAGDSYVAALGSFTTPILAAVGVHVPIYPVKGVSITVPGAAWPERVSTCIGDDSGLYGLVPLGDRLRVAGSAEIDGYDATPSRARCEAIVKKVIAMFPGFAGCYDPSTAKFWGGIRPVTPTGTPVLDRSPLANLFVAAGHGHLGWTLGCGSGHVVADLVAGKTPAIDTTGLRYVR